MTGGVAQRFFFRAVPAVGTARFFAFRHTNSRGETVNRKAAHRPRDAKILKKYDITEEQFSQIADELAEALSFGKCSLCA